MGYIYADRGDGRDLRRVFPSVLPIYIKGMRVAMPTRTTQNLRRIMSVTLPTQKSDSHTPEAKTDSEIALASKFRVKFTSARNY